MKHLLHKLSTNTQGDGSAVSTVQALRCVWPQWGLRMDDVENKLKSTKGVGAKSWNWAASMEGDSLKLERVHSAQVCAHTPENFDGSLPVSDSLDVIFGSGLEAGA